MRIKGNSATSRSPRPGLSRTLARPGQKSGRPSRDRMDVSDVGSGRSVQAVHSSRSRDGGHPSAREGYDLFSWAAAHNPTDETPRRRLKITADVRGKSGRVLESRETGTGNRFGEYALLGGLRLGQGRSKRINVHKNRLVLLVIMAAAVLYSLIKILSRF